MKVGDMVTVLPHGGGVYLVVRHLRLADTDEAQKELGSLWELYSEETGIYKMHEKWMKLIAR